MNKINHSKYKNTGILFETLIRTITADTLSGKDSKALGILKKYFTKTELGKEYKLYKTITESKNLSEGKADIIINSIIDSSKNLNRGALKRLKYNLIKEISDNYNIDEFFKIKLPNYKTFAALYTLLEIYNSEDTSNHEQIITNKLTLLEGLTSKNIDKQKIENGLLEEFRSYDKDTRILTYKILLEKFNDKYDGLNNKQKIVLKEYINSVDSTIKLKEFYNNKIEEIRTSITNMSKNIKDKVIQIKLNEVNNLLLPLGKKDKMNDNHLVNLLQYYELLEECTKLNESKV